MRRRTWIILGVVAAILIGGYVFARARSSAPPAALATDTVRRGMLRATVLESGSVESASEVKVTPLLSGQVDRVIVKNGETVKAGDAILALVTDSPAVKFKQAQAALARSNATLALLVRGAKPEEVAAQKQSVENAHVSLEKARAVYDATLAQATRDLASASASVASASSRAASAQAKARDVTTSTAADLAILQEQRTSQRAKVERLDDQRTIHEDIVEARDDAAEQALANAQAALSRAQTSRNACTPTSCTADQIAKLDDAVSAAQASVSTAQASVETTRRSGELEMQQSEDALDSAREALAQLDAQIASTQAKSLTSVNDAAAAASQAQTDLTGQQAAAAATRAGVELRRKNAESALAQAEAQLATAKAQLALVSRAATTEDLASARADVASAEASLLDARTTLGNATLRSPIAGTISQLSIQPGENASPTTVVAVVTASGDLRVTVNISEAEVARVAVGQPAELTFDALDQSILISGTVAEIETTPTIVQGVVFYATRIDIETGGDAAYTLRSGMTANVTIVTMEAENVLLVPSRAVRNADGATTVSVKQPDGSYVEQPVTIGRKGDDTTEIVSGLTEGATIATVRPKTTTPST